MGFGTIEFIPVEVFEGIVSYLDVGDEARLYSTCRRLHNYGGPSLLGPFQRNQRAVLWALRHDDVALLKRCVAAGAPPSVVAVFKTKQPKRCVHSIGEPGRPRVCSPKRLSTLALAARQRSLRTFEYLSAQGVGFEGVAPAALKVQLRALMKRLVTAARLGTLQTLTERGFLSKIEACTDQDTAWPLSRAILAGASETLVQMFVDAGADVNAAHEHRRFGSISPLSAAILASGTGMKRLLVRHGAVYEQPALYVRPVTRPTRHPLFAAVQRLAQSQIHDTSAVEDCLAHGCCINRTEPRVWDRGFNWDWRPLQQFSTPLLEFLDAIPSMTGSAAQKRAALQNLAFLLARGARTPAAPDDVPGTLIQSTTPSCLELLIDRWQVEALNDDHFFAIVTMLVESGRMDGAMGRIMRRYCRGVRNRDPYFAAAWRGWRRLVDLFLARRGVDPSALLLHLLVDSGTKEMAAVERLLVAAVDHLLARGADINAPASPLGSSALHMLCTVYQHPAPDSMWWNRSPYQESVVEHRRGLLRLMMSRGADPLLRFRGRNAPTELVQHLAAADPSTRAWIRKVGRTLCEGMIAQRLDRARHGGRACMRDDDDDDDDDGGPSRAFLRVGPLIANPVTDVSRDENTNYAG
ncbi:ankyrin repeat-containing domain [Cordyceps javanica]|uniref:Ankyrin repeat-containing domain n=1 Tax=Cordyceps javanica TaxID=43265 RepID=A0A545VHD6_9HYPO|nr:ankyrin repeat-containing domain [Cordyceps javanica]TQW12224.1 ankyrin repeat-containing domain [Cordyceps javanica]